MHLFRNNKEAKSRKSRLLSVALSAALVLGSFSVLSMADTKSEAAPANQVVENTAKVASKALPMTPTPGPTAPAPTQGPVSCGTNAYYELNEEGLLTIFSLESGSSTVTKQDWQYNTRIKKIHFALQDNNTLTVNSSTFKGLTALTSVEVDECAEVQFGSMTFYNCNSLKTMNINAHKVNFEGDCLGGYPFISANIYLPYVNSVSDFDLSQNGDRAYGELTFHFVNAEVANSLAIRAKDQEAYFGNYVCDNGDNPTPTPLPGGAAFSVATDGSRIALVIQLERIENSDYHAYDVTIDEVTYRDGTQNDIIDENGKVWLTCDVKDFDQKYNIKVLVHNGADTVLYEGSLSVADFLNRMIQDPQTDRVSREQATAMMDYCCAAKKYFNASTPLENLPNGGNFYRLNDDSVFPTDTYDGLAFARALHLDKSVYAGITLRFNAKLDFYMFFKVKDGFTAAAAEAELKDRYLNTQTEQIGFITNEEFGYVVLHRSSSDVNATLISFDINGDTQSVAIKDYIVKVLQQTDPAYENLQRLCKALYLINPAVGI